MSFKVWRKISDNSVIGFCDATFAGFDPGGDPSTYALSIEPTAPLMPAPPPTLTLEDRVTALEATTATLATKAGVTVVTPVVSP